MAGLDRLAAWVERHPLRCASILLFFHLDLSGLMYAIASSPYLAGMHNGHGLWNFAPDSFVYHEVAARLAVLMHQGDWALWRYGYPHWPHVRLIALAYYLLGAEPMAYAPVNALVWVCSISAVFAASRLLLGSPRHALVVAALFGLFPSYLLTTTTLLKDGLFILGLCLLYCGWIFLAKRRQCWMAVALLIAGVFVTSLIRSYFFPIEAFFISCGLVSLFVAWPVLRYPSAAGLAVILLLAFVRTSSSLNTPMLSDASPTRALSEPVISAPLSKPPPASSPPAENPVLQLPVNTSGKAGYSNNKITKVVEGFVQRIARTREGFISGHPHAASNLDVDVHFQSLSDELGYVPRALLIGFFSPFPEQWLAVGGQSGSMARKLAGVEMVVMYLLFMGCVVSVMWRPGISRILLPLIMISSSMMFLLGMTVSNVGAIYRMRYGFLIPFMMMGVYGLSILGPWLYSRIFQLQDSLGK